VRSASADLIALLATKTQFFIADLYTFYDATGAVIGRYTSADQDIKSGGNVFLANSLRIEKTSTKLKIGVEVDEEWMTIYPAAADVILSGDLRDRLRRGAFDYGRVKRERAFMPTFGDVSAGTIVMFVGRISKVDFSATKVRMKLLSDLWLLNQDMPRNTFQGDCIHSWADSGCTLSKAAYAVNCAIATGSSLSNIVPASFSAGSLSYAQGTITFTSGVNQGVTRTMKIYDGTEFVLFYPLESACGIGDSFTVYPNCGRTKAGCASFSNTAHFRAFDNIPAAETAV
jgi:uncharacterized phage protein (TIGR02218 family)